RPERTHVQPDCGGAGTAVESKCQRTLGRILAIECVGDKKHFRFDFSVGTFEWQASGSSRVFQQGPIDSDLVVRDDRRDFADVVVFLLVVLVFVSIFDIGVFGWLWLGFYLRHLRWGGLHGLFLFGLVLFVLIFLGRIGILRDARR